jgi:hypothetical protein
MLEEETQKVKYVKHPVSRADKIKLRKQGFKIIDERFDPNYKPPTKAPAPVVPVVAPTPITAP